MRLRHTAEENRIATVHGRRTVYFNDITARISAYNNTDRMSPYRLTWVQRLPEDLYFHQLTFSFQVG